MKKLLVITAATLVLTSTAANAWTTRGGHWVEGPYGVAPYSPAAPYAAPYVYGYAPPPPVVYGYDGPVYGGPVHGSGNPTGAVIGSIIGGLIGGAIR